MKQDNGNHAATPGPWDVFVIASAAGQSFRIFKDGAPAVDIAHIPMEWAGNGANARLIAAAPELLEALELFLRQAWSKENGLFNIPGSVLKTAQAAIAKAKGY